VTDIIPAPAPEWPFPHRFLIQQPNSIYATWFKADRDHFDANRRMGLAIRREFDGEIGPVQQSEPNLAHIWCAISKLSSAMHLVVPIWRGEKLAGTRLGYVDATSDGELTAIIKDCLAVDGYSPAERSAALLRRVMWGASPQS
jgi:hypothetical protein